MIKIYTDGSCLENPGDGGWAAIIIIDQQKKIISGNQENTTNNRMELLAPIEALKTLKKKTRVEIITDSKYVKLGITEWIHNWKMNGWQTSNKKEVKNIDLWKQLDSLVKDFDTKWSWVKGHSTDLLNNEVDLLAKKAAKLN